MSHAGHARLAMRNHVRRDVIPSHRLPFLVPTTSSIPTKLSSIVARSESAEPTSGVKPTSDLTTTVLPVVLGAGIPILCAIIILIVLHRRHVKKLMREDAMDKHKSLDFGMDTVGPATSRKGMPQMSEPTHTKGLSLDVGPYLLPPGLEGSPDSLRSLSIDDDKYRPATASIRSYPRNSRFEGSDDGNSGLLQNAQRMSRSSPPLYPPSSPNPRNDRLGQVPGVTRPPAAQQPGMAKGSPNASRIPTPDPLPHLDASSGLDFGLGDTYGNSYSAPHEDRPNFPLPDSSQPRALTHDQGLAPQLPRISLPASDVSDYGDDKSQYNVPSVNIHGAEDVTHSAPSHDNQHPELPEDPPNLDTPYDRHRDTRRMTLGLRPLPPEDPSDNPEQRANRIRSFYKEYFDESKGPEATYSEDFGPEFYEDGNHGAGFIYDPTTGDYYDAAHAAPFAEPITRRAMTPPPRAPPRFQGAAARHQATNSAGQNGMPSPRAFSSASGRMPPRGPKKAIPPPSPLHILPTPHMLTDDSLLTAMEFAPANGIKERRAGRPETPSGGLRPYQPGPRAHTPLASAFDELIVMPSPHALRKSGTFTNLDFVPPPRFKNESGTGSDAGSIRSARSAVSATLQQNIRAGTYRVSRLPAEAVGTKDDMMASLRPKWDMNNA
ncbi:hypothetical protein DTO013E5_4017 [Penicillium roqueforti]|uniref:Genomic scaffold, ProqFM164S01 n=1 Tax=Penicillium roqueforti (strain FM164) TaxID=1365484 RepID=W6PUZ4_PENRF|nr:uncharacterized protein LCP9604111_1552 [Penicillium roqueforti]CDM28053.1 unnamed protein product [Penicillium roqueforti FM164]KAF9251556.1 hypothetical protein LCP9604111_1552 [Penicillium roqueforti]KAI1836631.1 hypothetical protein CBS147337_2858 [Penicillium roqueforti]KAI2685231.1 hypothetical protein LCP963914a_4558 [Penicillium roqueforti]KAI2690427.1 hypothetical protein CBS147355_878 [Penicillium roqueforti]